MSAQIVPLDSPVLTSSSVCLGSCTKKPTSAAPSSTQRMLSLTHCVACLRGGAPAGASGIDAASMNLSSSGLSHIRSDPRERRSRRPAGHRGFKSGGPLRLEDLVEDQLAVLDDVRAVVRQRGVAVLVDRVLAEDRIAVLDLEERVDDGLAVVALVAGVLDREQRDLHRLVAVDRVRLGVLAVLLLERVEE